MKKHLDIITAGFVTVLILSNIASSKIVGFGPINFDGGTILFPLAYIFGDILTEIYGFKTAKRVIWTGFAANILMVLVFLIVGALPSAQGWNFQNSYNDILGFVPRIVLGSLCAYLAGEFLNSWSFEKIKAKTGEKRLYLRALGSTVLGQFFDTTIFTLIAFAGILPWNLLFSVWLTNYIFKNLVEIACLPITYRVVAKLKAE